MALEVVHCPAHPLSRSQCTTRHGSTAGAVRRGAGRHGSSGWGAAAAPAWNDRCAHRSAATGRCVCRGSCAHQVALTRCVCRSGPGGGGGERRGGGTDGAAVGARGRAGGRACAVHGHGVFDHGGRMGGGRSGATWLVVTQGKGDRVQRQGEGRRACTSSHTHTYTHIHGNEYIR
jgi:hypothetical protein